MHLVTGGAGFIGSHLVERLVSMGEAVRVLDNFSFGTNDNIHSVRDKIEIIRGDVLDASALRKAMEGIEVVFHQAALRSVPFSVDNPGVVNQVNVDGTLDVLLAARDAGVRRVVYASSSSVYGDTDVTPKKEKFIPRPLSPYAVSKLAGEHYCKVFRALYGLETVSLRYFNVFGPRQDPNSQYAAVIPRFICWALAGEPLEIHGDGLQSRDFTYVENVIDANLFAARSPEAVGAVINVAQGKEHTLLDLVDLLGRILNREVQWIYKNARAGDIRRSLADISVAKRLLGYRPRVAFEEGIVKTVEFFARQRTKLSSHEFEPELSLAIGK
ncbi:MAG: SDR family oxidoreductase [Deltaproteobacteria bacterium]|nr:SDR family oxidoreductase [Deltaproteobacteria bacterium]